MVGLLRFAGKLPNAFPVGVAGRAGIHDAPENAASFVGDEQVFTTLVRPHLRAGRTAGNELSAVQARPFQTVKVKAHGDLGDIHVTGGGDVASTISRALPAGVIHGAQVAVRVEGVRVAGLANQ